MNVTTQEIENYLLSVKKAVKKGRYKIAKNDNRLDNLQLFLDYIIDEAKVKEILMSLTVRDFSEILKNKHKNYEEEELYVFGKEVLLLERYGVEEKNIPLYIKFNKLKNSFVIVISFHKQKYPLTYPFKTFMEEE